MKKQTGIVFSAEFTGAAPKITVWSEGSIDPTAKKCLLLIADPGEPLPDIEAKDQRIAALEEVVRGFLDWFNVKRKRAPVKEAKAILNPDKQP